MRGINIQDVYITENEYPYQEIQDEESFVISDKERDCIDYINFISDNRVIVRHWKEEEKARVKCEHISLEIPHKNFYRAVAIKKENGIRKARFITSYEEDRDDIMGRKHDSGISLFHLNTDLIMEAAEKHNLFSPDYKKYIATSSLIDNDVVEAISLNCAMFVRSLLESGGLNTLMNIRKRSSFVGRSHFLLIALSAYLLMTEFNFTDQNILKGIKYFLGLSSAYSMVPFWASLGRFILGQRGIHTTPSGVFNLCQESHIHELKEMQDIIFNSTKLSSQCLDRSPRIFIKLLGLILEAALGIGSGALGAKILSINHTGYDAQLCAKVTAAGMCITLPIAKFFKSFDRRLSKSQVANFAPKQKLIQSARNNLSNPSVPDEKMTFGDELTALAMTLYAANISGTLLLKHFLDEEMPMEHAGLSYLVGSLFIIIGLICFIIKALSCRLAYKASQEEKERGDSERFNILDHAISNDDDFVLDFLMESSLNMKYINGKNIFSLLISAVKQGNMRNTRQLIEAKADVNHTTRDMHTPLSIAACQGYLLITQRLVEAKADLHITVQGKTALEWAQQRNNEEVATYLQSASASHY
ncbi:MAG: ankyrin repeat domain-containing protein [Proteobacteria bacterium]|nr:ankyrin repeat domain-containing protein [Pseudomonadota bacterium]